MATPSSSTPTPVFVPKLNFSRSLDLSSDSESTPNSETTTLADRHDNLKESPRSSLCSSRSDESNDSTNGSKQQPPSPKRVRFQESVCCSFFDVEQNIPQPELEHKPSFLGRSWARFKSRNGSGDLDPTPSGLQNLKRMNSSMDALGKVTTSASGRPTLTRRSTSGLTTLYSIQQPLRESAGRRYNAADTHAIWRASQAKAKGDWDDLLSNPRQSRLYA